ncbi:LOW QUALITY PROTEIN: hypothetical protein PHMEG_00014936 [Phytophthora megakarya]|uniref:Uncharacterized protein n=1 Tax=Phytophthora megakarya TaxID=4795 RepID=A0A225W346_9STRA|nr:LOW QUALITY PROTEIN: hypothetical protein PHMEG_00014936 [Phytophthora megakarya]
MLPVNLGDAHCCESRAKRIYYYDPLNQSAYLQTARDITKHIKIRCGVDVSWMFIRQASAGTPIGMSVSSLFCRRFELFHTWGRLLTRDEPLPPATEGDVDQEKVPESEDNGGEYKDEESRKHNSRSKSLIVLIAGSHQLD